MSPRYLPLAFCLLWPPLDAFAGRGASGTPVGMPSAYSQGNSGEITIAPWWDTFNDPAMSGLMHRGLANNLDVVTARSRIQQARALAQQALAPLLPQVSFDAQMSAAPLDTLGFQFGGFPTDPNAPSLYTSSSARFNANLAVDPFGRDILGATAGARDARATEADADAVAMSMAQQLANAWFELALQLEQVRVVEAQVETNKTLLELVERRFDRGEATGLEVLQQRQQLAATEANQPLAELQRDLAAQQLSVLLGEDPTKPPPMMPTGLVTLPPAPAVGQPRDLMANRPDLRAADARLDAAWQRRMQKERSFLPSFGVNANAGWQFFDAGTLNEQFAWGIGAQASFPIFDAGLTIAGLRQARANEAIAQHQLSGAVLAATQQVEAALAQERAQRLRLEATQTRAAAAELAWQESSRRYEAGLVDFLTVLTTLTARDDAQLGALQAHRDALNARVQLHTALGGAWTKALASGGTP